MNIKFEWDEHKNIINQLKHKISFELATQVFEDCFHLTLEIQHINHEERWLTIGRVSNIYLIVVYTYIKITYITNTFVLFLHGKPLN